MRENQIQRMNFIGRGESIFDYQHIAFFFVAWVVFLFSVSGIQYFRLWYANHNVKIAKTELAALMQDQERRLAMLELSGPKVDKQKQQDLIEIFKNPPCWSCIMDEVQNRILRSLRIKLLKTSEDTDTGRFVVRIEGEAPSMRSVVEFLQRLQLSPLFRDVVLVKANRDVKKGNFAYIVDAKILIFKRSS